MTQLIISRNNDYDLGSYFTFQVVDDNAAQENSDGFSTAFNVPARLEERVKHTPLSLGFGFRWDAEDYALIGFPSLEIITNDWDCSPPPALDDPELVSYVLSKMFQVLYEDGQKPDTPFEKDSCVFKTGVSEILLPHVVVRGFKDYEDTEPLGTYCGNIFFASQRSEAIDKLLEGDLCLVVRRKVDYVNSVFFSYEVVETAVGITISDTEDTHVSVYSIPRQLEGVARRYNSTNKAGAGVRLRWHDYDMGQGHDAIEIAEFKPFGNKGSNDLMNTGLGSFMLSMTLAAVYEDAQKNETPFGTNGVIYAKSIDDSLLPLLKRRGFVEDDDFAPHGTYWQNISRGYEFSQKREKEKGNI